MELTASECKSVNNLVESVALGEQAGTGDDILFQCQENTLIKPTETRVIVQNIHKQKIHHVLSTYKVTNHLLP